MNCPYCWWARGSDAFPTLLVFQVFQTWEENKKNQERRQCADYKDGAVTWGPESEGRGKSLIPEPPRSQARRRHVAGCQVVPLSLLSRMVSRLRQVTDFIPWLTQHFAVEGVTLSRGLSPASQGQHAVGTAPRPRVALPARPLLWSEPGHTCQRRVLRALRARQGPQAFGSCQNLRVPPPVGPPTGTYFPSRIEAAYRRRCTYWRWGSQFSTLGHEVCKGDISVLSTFQYPMEPSAGCW